MTNAGRDGSIEAVKIPCDVKAKPSRIISVCNGADCQHGDIVCIPERGFPNVRRSDATAVLVVINVTISMMHRINIALFF